MSDSMMDYINFTAPTDPATELQRLQLAQRQAMAQKMLAQGSQPAAPQYTPGGGGAPPIMIKNSWAGPMNALQQIAGGIMQRANNQQQAQYMAQRNQLEQNMFSGGADAPSGVNNGVSPYNRMLGQALMQGWTPPDVSPRNQFMGQVLTAPQGPMALQGAPWQQSYLMYKGDPEGYLGAMEDGEGD